MKKNNVTADTHEHVTRMHASVTPLRSGWAAKQLSEVCEIGAGNSAPQRKELFQNGYYPFYRTSDVGKIHFGNIAHSADKLNENGISKLHLYKKGTILFPKSGASTFLNHRVMMATDGYVSSHLATLIPQEQVIDNSFLLYYLSIIDARDLMQDQNYPSLRLTDIQTINVPLPPLAEQKHIVAILDKAFAAIGKARENAEKNLANTREVFESYLNGVFDNPGEGWEENNLEKLCFENRVITYGVIKLGKEITKGVPCLRTSNVRWLDIDVSGIKKIEPNLSSSYSRTILKGNEVLVNVRGTLGGVAVSSIEMAGWNVSREVAVVPVNTNIIEPAFLAYYIASSMSQKWLGGVKKGAAYIGINIEDLRQLPIIFPNKIAQEKIIKELDSIKAATNGWIEIYIKKIACLDELKKSILDKAFRGELTGKKK